MIIKTLSPATRLYHDTIDIAEEYDILVLYDVMVEIINDIEKTKNEQNTPDRRSHHEYMKYLAEEYDTRKAYDLMVKTINDTEKAKSEKNMHDQNFLDVYMKFYRISNMYSMDVRLEVARAIVEDVEESVE